MRQEISRLYVVERAVTCAIPIIGGMLPYSISESVKCARTLLDRYTQRACSTDVSIAHDILAFYRLVPLAYVQRVKEYRKACCRSLRVSLVRRKCSVRQLGVQHDLLCPLIYIPVSMRASLQCVVKCHDALEQCATAEQNAAAF
jgi:hypothetical protein